MARNQQKLDNTSGDVDHMEPIDDVAEGSVDRLLKGLRASVHGRAKQYNRILEVLWYCYLSPDHLTASEAAYRVGITNSLVSDYRGRIEEELRAMSLNDVEEARLFDLALRKRVPGLIGLEGPSPGTTQATHRSSTSFQGPSSDVEDMNITIRGEQFERLSARAKEILTQTVLAQERMAKDQQEIELLKLETRETLKRLRAA